MQTFHSTSYTICMVCPLHTSWIICILIQQIVLGFPAKSYGCIRLPIWTRIHSISYESAENILHVFTVFGQHSVNFSHLKRKTCKETLGDTNGKITKTQTIFFPSNENVWGYIFQAHCRDRGIGMGSLKNLNIAKLTKYGLRFSRHCLIKQLGAWKPKSV